MAALTAKMATTNDEELDARRTELKNVLKERAKEIRSIGVEWLPLASRIFQKLIKPILLNQTELRELDTTTKKLRLQIAEQNKLIEAENAKASRTTDMSRQQALNRREEYERGLREQDSRLATLPDDIERLKEQTDSLKSQIREMNVSLGRSQADIDTTQGDLRNAQGAQKNRISAFGRAAELVSKDIDVSRWKTKPIGPLGVHVQCKEQRWGGVIDTLLGHSLNAYLVDNVEDENQLRKILKRHQW